MRSQAQIKPYSPGSVESRFLGHLLHDDRDSFYASPSIESGAWREGPCLSKKSLEGKLSKSKTCDRYISVSGYRCAKRAGSQIRQVNALLIDIDHHDLQPEECRRAVDSDWEKIQLDMAFGGMAEHFELVPTYGIDTGRGLQLWWIFERSIPNNGSKASGQALWLRERSFELLCDYFEKVTGSSVDRCVSDLSRVGRLPGTYNSKARRMTTILQGKGDSRPYCSLSALYSSLKELFKGQGAEEHAPKAQCRAACFNPLLMERKRSIEELCRRRAKSNAGRRNETLFAYAEAVVRLFDEEAALKLTQALNETIPQRLGNDEVQALFDSAVSRQKAGLKPYGAKKLKEHLQMTESESERFFKHTSSRQIARQARRDERRRRTRAMHALAAEGKSYASIAAEVGCTKQTVYNTLRRTKEARQRQKGAWRRALDAKEQETSKNLPSISCVPAFLRPVPGWASPLLPCSAFCLGSLPEDPLPPSLASAP